MAKLIVLSVILVTIILPIMMAERKKPKDTLRLILILTVVAIFIWAHYCLVVYPQLVPVD